MKALKLKLNSFVLALVLIISGCASPKPVIEYQTVEVKVPVPVPCKTSEPQKPETGFERLTEQHSLYEKIQTLLADRLLHLAYQTELRAALKSCQ